MAKLGISTGTVPNDGTGDSLLDGAIKINSNFNEIYNYFGDGTNLNFSNVDVWSRTGSGINTLSNVGIGTTNPRFSLEIGTVGSSGTSLWVNGNARVTGIFTVGSSSITLDGSNNVVSVGTGVTIYGNTGIVSATDFYANGIQVGVISATTIVYQGGTLYNTWQQSATGIHTLSNVGVGTTNATRALTVKGNTSLETLNVSGVSTFVGVSTFATAYAQTINAQTINVNTSGINVAANIPAYFGNTSDGYIAFLSGDNSFHIRTPGGVAPLVLGAGTVRITNGNASSEFARFTGIGLTVTGTTFTDNLRVGTGGTTITTNSAGSVGIGTTNPGYKLTVYDGSIALQSPGKNPLDIAQLVDNTFIIRTSGNDPISIAPNNSIKLTVNNSGALVSGILTATSFIGDGSGLTGVIGSGSGVVIKDSGSTVGTAGTIDFGDNLTVSSVSAGIVTVTAIPTNNFYDGGVVTGNIILTTANKNQLVPVSTGSSISITLPAGSGLSAGDGFTIVDVGSSETSSGNAATYNITITPNASDRIMGGPTGDSLIIDQNGASVKLVWMGSTYDWRIV